MGIENLPFETRATRLLRAANIWFIAHTYDPKTAAASDVARLLKIEPSRMYKSLVVRCSDGRLVLAVIPGSTKLDLRALASVMRTRQCALADRSTAETATHSKVGEISPLGLLEKLRAVVDKSALSCSSVYVSGGARGLEIELEPRDLVALCDGITAPIAV